MDRTGYIGGSDAAAILGVSPWKSPYQLYLEKVGEYTEDQTDVQREKALKRGKRLEPVVLEMLMDELKDRGHDVRLLSRNKRYTHYEHPFLACEVDAELFIDGEDFNCEIKTCHPFAAKEWGVEGTDEIPIFYTTQVLHGLMIVPRQRAIVACLIGADDLRIHYVNRDQEAIDMIRAKELAFWKRVQEREPPEPTTAEDIKILYGRDQGLVMEADDDLIGMWEELKDQRSAMELHKECKEHLEMQIKLRMGDASVLMHDGRKICTWFSNADRLVIDWKAIAIELNPPSNLIGKHTTVKPGARPFLVR